VRLHFLTCSCPAASGHCSWLDSGFLGAIVCRAARLLCGAIIRARSCFDSGQVITEVPERPERLAHRTLTNDGRWCLDGGQFGRDGVWRRCIAEVTEDARISRRTRFRSD
jgi:hypothetical protein